MQRSRTKGRPTRRERVLRPAGVALVPVILAVACQVQGLRLLWLKWQGVDVAVFEADTYAQGVRHAVALGSAWPWDLTGRFWPFLLMAPGIYLHLPLMVALPGGLPVLVFQGLAMGLTALLLALLARREGADPALAAGLALVWMLHPITGVAFAWGWSPYATAAPLLAGGLLALRAGHRRVAAVLLAVAAMMKINVAIMVGGLALAAAVGLAGGGLRRAGRVATAVAAGWVLLVGAVFAGATWCTGTLSEDLHIGGPTPATAAGSLTLLLVLAPLLPLLGRRGLLLSAASTGVELAYTAVVNPANSGLVPAAAVVSVAAALDLPTRPRPGRRLALAGLLALVGQQTFQPPRISPLPLTPAGLTYRADPRGAAVRAWVDALPDDAWLLTFDPVNGAIGRHPGRVVEPREWDGRTRVAVLLDRALADRLGLAGCTAVLVPEGERGPEIVAGWCGDRPPDPEARATPNLECLDGLELDRP